MVDIKVTCLYELIGLIDLREDIQKLSRDVKELAIKGGQIKGDGTYTIIALKSVERIIPVLARRDRELVLVLRR